MKNLPLILGAAWILSIGAAYLVGQGARESESDGEEATSSRSKGLGRTGRSASASSSRTGTPGSSRRPRSNASKSGQDPKKLVVKLAKLTDPVERAQGFLDLIDSLSPDQFEEVVSEFRALGLTQQRLSEYGMLLHAWGQSDPEAALTYALNNTGTPFARQTILASWSTRDPESAIAFARDNHEGEGANPLLIGVIRGLAPTNINRATDLLQELPYSRERGEALRSILPQITQKGVESALEWSRSIIDDQLRSGAATFIISDLSAESPKEAAAALADLDDPSVASRVVDDIAGSWARRSLDEAIAWTQTLDSDLLGGAVEGVIGTYASKDPTAAANWLSSLPNNTNLDGAIGRFAWTSMQKEPQLAAEWVGQIANEKRRNEMFHGVLSRWWQRDSSAAETWMSSQQDAPQIVHTLLERYRQRRQNESRR